MNKRKTLLLFAACFWLGISPAARCGTDGTENVSSKNTETGLTLTEAVRAALENNPDLNASKFNLQIGAAALQQSKLFPNPEIEFEYENFDEPEKTLTVGYLLEVGGKRNYRRSLAEAALNGITAELKAARVEIACDTAAAFVDLLVAQERLIIAREKAKLADQIQEIAAQRVLAGQVSPMEEISARIKQDGARLDVQKAESETRIARTVLAVMWGGTENDVTKAVGRLEETEPLPTFESLTAFLDNAPLIRTQNRQVEIAEENLSLEKRYRIPDLSLSAGMKKVGETDDTVYIVGLSLPIPLFDRNQADIARAAAELGRQQAGLFAQKNRLRAEIKAVFENMKTVHDQVLAVRTEILPSARKVLEAVKTGYREGEFSLLALLEAQQTFYEAKENYVQSLGDYHHTVIELEKRLGRGSSDPDLNQPL